MKAPIFCINLTPSARQWAAQLHCKSLALRLFATGEERNINSQQKALPLSRCYTVHLPKQETVKRAIMQYKDSVLDLP
jgi:predicted HAD superfamily phosphohydrolase YqeG